MQRYLFLAALVCFGVALAGCGSSVVSGPGGAVHGSTHNVRSYAAMSMPAFLPDGCKFVANGSKLLKFSSNDALLDSIDLPLDLAQRYVVPRVIGTAAGSIFVLLGDGRVGRVNAAGQFEWLQDFGAFTNSAAPFGDGLLVTCMSATARPVRLIDSDGNVQLELNGATALPGADATADTGYAFFLLEGNLWVADTFGNWLLQDTPIADTIAPRLICATAGRVLLGDSASPGSLVCCNLDGVVIWRAQLPEGFRQRGVGLLTSDGAALVPAAGYTTASLHQSLVQLYAADGAPQAALVGLTINSLSVLDANRFAAAFYISDKLHYGLFTNAGEPLWSFPQPDSTTPASYESWEDRTIYSASIDSFSGPDQRIYFQWESTLYALDLQGREVWREAGHEYVDKVVPNSSGQPATNPGGASKPAGGPSPIKPK